MEKKYMNDSIVQDIADAKEITWVNPEKKPWKEAMNNLGVTGEEIDDAEARLNRFAPFIMKCFPETKEKEGLIESELVQISRMQAYLKQANEGTVRGTLLLKKDSHLF